MGDSVNQVGARKISANSLIFTLFGDLAYQSPGPNGKASLSIAALVSLMAAVGISQAAVRQAASRLARQGWLETTRHAKRAVYSPTQRGLRRIAEISPRIYGPVIDWDGRWRLLVIAPATQRRTRERFFKELRVLGWAPLTGGIWLSPGDSVAAAFEAAAAQKIEAHVFTGTYDGPLRDRELIERCWNLARIAAAYHQFIAVYRPQLARERDAADADDRAAFAQRLRLVHDYRKFAYLDPGLPSELVAADWPRTQAAAVFRSYYELLERKAARFMHRHSGAADGQTLQTDRDLPASNRGGHAQTRYDSVSGHRPRRGDSGLQ